MNQISTSVQAMDGLPKQARVRECFVSDGKTTLLPEQTDFCQDGNKSAFP